MARCPVENRRHRMRSLRADPTPAKWELARGHETRNTHKKKRRRTRPRTPTHRLPTRVSTTSRTEHQSIAQPRSSPLFQTPCRSLFLHILYQHNHFPTGATNKLPVRFHRPTLDIKTFKAFGQLTSKLRAD